MYSFWNCDGPISSFFAFEILRQHSSGRKGIVGEGQLAHAAAGEGHLVGGVVDDEGAAEPEAVGVFAEHAQGGGVKCADERAAAGAACKPIDPFEHLIGSLVGEGDGEDGGGVDVAMADQPGDAVGDDAGFAGAGTGENEQRPAFVCHCFALLGVEVCEIDHVVVVLASGKVEEILRSTLRMTVMDVEDDSYRTSG